ncbi:heavy metal translocating P-type ATPase [Sutterella sp.]|uniref:heavy metal translocating P-type ATPase n=1 Tax=Sutterella sp. TaxID=1981025 RepID=UPI0026E04DE5|nr:heavy metal translocating P-type ATPase [Sutterella sp.]MDO5532718.1 heavy metal translocating P-type ATPase [Sutterella sp.]
MQFELKHAVGNRERWKTAQTLSHASAVIIADEISAIPGITGLVVNPRTGSVTLTVADAETKLRTAAYFRSLEKNPPILRPGRAAIAAADREKAKNLKLEDLSFDIEKATRELPPGIVSGTLVAIERGFTNMPVLNAFGRIREFLANLFPALFRIGRTAATASQAGQALGEAARTRREGEAPAVTEADAELDFSSLARYIFLRPLFPMVVNIGNAVLDSIPYIIEGVKNLFRGKLNVSVLDASAIIVSLLRLDFGTVGLLTLLLGLGDMLERYTRKKSLASLADQLAIKVDQVWVRTESGKLAQKQLNTLTAEDLVVVRSGSVIPVDGVVVTGDASVNQATMTGEPLPVHRTTGGSVFAGTVVEDGEIDIRPTALGDASRLSQIVNFIQDSEAAKAGIQGKAERLADAIVPYNFLLAGIVFLLTRNLTRTASVLMVDYSCALRLATPLAILTAMKTGTEKGVLVKGGRYLEALSEVDTVVFDKTGTLTQASPVLSDVVPTQDKYDEKELLRLAACLEEHFPHPVSRAIVRAAQEEGVFHDDEAHDTEVRYIVAHGICSSVGGLKCVLGSRHFVGDDEGIDLTDAKPIVERLASEGKSILYLAVGGRLAGVLGIEDPVRPEAVEAIKALRACGISRILMLTGDDTRTAAHVAERLGLDGFRAQVLPQDKARHVLELKAEGRRVLMVGDGINDSPALSAAHVGATLRDGTDIAQEVADVVLTRNDLMDLPTAIELGRATMARVKQNFGVSVSLNTCFLAGGLTGILMPALGALLHNATTIGVCLNAMRPTLGNPRNFAEAVAQIEQSMRGTFSHFATQVPESEKPIELPFTQAGDAAPQA